MTSIPIHLLEAFVVFSQAKHMQDAADKLGVTQSALSKQLILLEEKVPHPLFAFSGRKKTLTKYGGELASQLQMKLLGLEEQVQSVNRKFTGPENSHLKVAARREILERVAPKIRFKGQITFIDSSSEQIFQDLLSRKIDIGLTQEIPDSLNLSSQKIFSDEMVVIAPKSYDLPKEGEFNKKIAKTLSEKPFLAYSADAPVMALLNHCVQSPNLKVLRRYANWRGICEMVENELGWALVPNSFSPNLKVVSRLELPKAHSKTTTFYFVYLKEMNTIPWFKDLKAEFLQEK
ncbi:MAG: LysR family transcriptional regulator [Pseudobdellovibrionaceae bacterium]